MLPGVLIYFLIFVNATNSQEKDVRVANSYKFVTNEQQLSLSCVISLYRSTWSDSLECLSRVQSDLIRILYFNEKKMPTTNHPAFDIKIYHEKMCLNCKQERTKVLKAQKRVEEEETAWFSLCINLINEKSVQSKQHTKWTQEILSPEFL